MTTRITWLPLGHIPHGYRRVFLTDGEGQAKHVLALAPMPYEMVYGIKQLDETGTVQDPALWWGLSTVTRLLADPNAFETSDDGYLQVRPKPLSKEELISLSDYHAAFKNGEYLLP